MAVKADITIDIDKQVGNLQNLTNIYNARVGDNKTPLTVLWRKNGMALNLKGLHAFIAGKVGDGSYNAETDKVDFPVGTPVVKYEDDGSGTLDNGQSGLTTLLIPKQMWSKTGLFAGYIGLKDENGSVFTSKDIFFKVLGNVLDAGVAINYFIGDFDKALAKAEKELEDKNTNFDQTTTQALQDLHDKYLAKAQKAEDTLGDTQIAIDASLASFKQLAISVGSLQAQLDARDLETNFDHKADIKALKDDIGFRFSQIKHPVQAYDSLDQIKAKYPNGADGDYLAVDTGHIYIYQWDTKSWKDCGVYQSQGLSQNDQSSLKNALKSIGETLDPTKAPYNDLNDLPLNQIVTYPHTLKVKHLPNLLENTDIGFTIKTYSYHVNGGIDGAVQDLTTKNGDKFWRVSWGDPASYQAWHHNTYASLDIVQSEMLKTSPYNDLNLLPDNTLYVYAQGLDQINNRPAGFEHGIVITSRSRSDDYGKFQIVSSEDQVAFRIWWKEPSPQPWIYLNNSFALPQIFGGDNSDIDPKYNDLNTLQLNQVVTYSHSDNIQNFPKNWQGGTIITLGAPKFMKNNFLNGQSAGAMQFAMSSKGELAWRIKWGDPISYTAWQIAKPNIYKPSPSLALFRKVGIIGDSYASGELAFTVNTDHYNMSWGQILARKNGATAINYSRGGQTTRGWLADTERGLGLLNSTDPQDLYILALGINDYQKLGESYLGSEDDINKGADTYYGNYGKIIKAIQAKAPYAKIVISTLSQTDNVATQYNEAIQKIAKHFGIPCLVLNEDKLFTSDFWRQNLHGGHPTGPIYAEMANAYERLISQAMVEDIDYFENYEEGMPTDNANDLNRINAKTSVESLPLSHPQAQSTEPKQ